MDRLVKLSEDNTPYCAGLDNALGYCAKFDDCYDCPQFHDMLAKLKHYEELEEIEQSEHMPEYIDTGIMVEIPPDVPDITTLYVIAKQEGNNCKIEAKGCSLTFYDCTLCKNEDGEPGMYSHSKGQFIKFVK